MAVRITLDAEHRTELPVDARKQLGNAGGSSVLVEVGDGFLIVRPDPVDVVERLRGLHRDIWEGVDPVEYVRRGATQW